MRSPVPMRCPIPSAAATRGGTVLLSMTAPDGILFEYLDENMENGWTLSIEQYVDAWNKGTPYGTAPRPAEATA